MHWLTHSSPIFYHPLSFVVYYDPSIKKNVKVTAERPTGPVASIKLEIIT